MTTPAHDLALDDDVKARLEEIAKATNRDASQLLNDAVRAFIEHDERYRAAVREGVRSADQGELVAWGDAKADLLARIAGKAAGKGR